MNKRCSSKLQGIHKRERPKRKWHVVERVVSDRACGQSRCVVGVVGHQAKRESAGGAMTLDATRVMLNSYQLPAC